MTRGVCFFTFDETEFMEGCRLMNEKGSAKHSPHDEAFKKLLQTFFAEFIELFFPELDKLLDYSHTRFLMQELLVDIVGEEKRTLDLLLETRCRGSDAYVLVHLEPQSYKTSDFHERMFIYFSRLFERHRNEHKLIIPIAIFTANDARDERDTLSMVIQDRTLLYFQFLKVELRNQDWRRFIDSDNPVAAALLALMGYNKNKRREMRFAYLRMILRLRNRLDDARLALVMLIADLYFKPDRNEEEALLNELIERYPEEGEAMKELMPAWKRWGYEEGLELGMERGMETAAINMLRKSMDASLIAEITGLSAEKVEALRRKMNGM
jgi:predicted transposase/invertase (TIGR01784 family)